MATIALMVAGKALFAGAATGGMFGVASLTGAAIGASIGTMAGGMVDQFLLGPLIFGGPEGINSEGPRVKDINILKAAEGASIPWVLGPTNEVAGVLMYAGNFIEEAVTSSTSGGKGGGGASSSSTSYTYYIDLWVGFHDGLVDEITKVWGDNKKILETIPKLQRLSKQATVTRRNNWQIIDIVDINMRRYVIGSQITFGGFAFAVNDGTYKLRSAKRTSASGVKPETWRLKVINTNAVDEAPGAAVYFVMAGATRGAGRVDNIEYFLGTETQAKWSVIEADKGSANTPAFRGLAGVGLEKFALNDFGERVPNFTAQIAGADSATVQEAITKVMLGADYLAEEFDVTRVRGDLRGMSMAGHVQSSKRLEPLLNGYQLRVRLSNGVFIFYERGDENVMVVPESELLGREPRFEIKHKSIQALPTSMGVRYVDVGHKMEPGYEVFAPFGNANMNPGTMEVPLVLKGHEARRLGRDVYYSLHNETREVSFVLGPKYMDAEETDIIIIDYNGEINNVRIITATRGANMEIEINGIIEDTPIIDRTTCVDESEADVPDDDDPPIPVPSDLSLMILDIPAIEADHVTQAGFYIAVSPFDANQAFRGATVFQSWASDGSEAWNAKEAVSTYPVAGELVSAMGPTPIVVSNITYLAEEFAAYQDQIGDRPIVEIYRGGLGNAAALDVENGINNILIGNEIVGFQEAELLSPGHYKLKKLLRGMRGTRWAMNQHVPGERVILLNKQGIVYVDKHKGGIGQTRYFKAVPSGGIVTDFDQAETYQTEAPDNAARVGVFQANSLRPFAPTNVIWAPSAGTDTITWEFVTRQFSTALQEGEPSLGEEENYQISVWDKDTANPDVDAPVRSYNSKAYDAVTNSEGSPSPNGSAFTINGDGTSLFSYSSADKAADKAVGSWTNMYARLYQDQKNYGLGSYEEIY